MTVLYADAGQKGQIVVLACQRAVRSGIVPGMPLAEAKGILGRGSDQAFVRHDAEADRADLHELANWCQQFSPVVGVEDRLPSSLGAEGLLLDITGCALLFGGEDRLLQCVLQRFQQRGYFVRAAIADTIGAAWAVAHFGKERAAVVPPQQQERVLRPLPVAALRLSATTIAALTDFAIDTIEQLQALPRALLPARFGEELVRRLDQALGTVAEIIVPIQPPVPIEATWEFEQPVSHRNALAVVLRQLARRIMDELIARSKGVVQLEVRLHCPGKQDVVFPVGFLRPCQALEHLMELVLLHLERVEVPGEITGAELRVLQAAVVDMQQSPFFDGADKGDASRQLAQLIERLSSRLGSKRVVRPRLRADWQPEYAVRWQPLVGPGSERFLEGDSRPVTLSRPLRLRRKPSAIEAVSVVPEGPPIRFFWKDRNYAIVCCWGQERIETGWWRGRHIERDYFQVETESGQRFWIFRQIGKGNWFLHGEFE
ncbi:MAG: protein ImuB [Gemmatales bacterium]|nr:MAG: protein ImuB [Gemmatales bacterium]